MIDGRPKARPLHKAASPHLREFPAHVFPLIFAFFGVPLAGCAQASAQVGSLPSPVVLATTIHPPLQVRLQRLGPPCAGPFLEQHAHHLGAHNSLLVTFNGGFGNHLGGGGGDSSLLWSWCVPTAGRFLDMRPYAWCYKTLLCIHGGPAYPSCAGSVSIIYRLALSIYRLALHHHARARSVCDASEGGGCVGHLLFLTRVAVFNVGTRICAKLLTRASQLSSLAQMTMPTWQGRCSCRCRCSPYSPLKQDPSSLHDYRLPL